MQKPVYKRELSHSYLIINDVLEETWNSYQYRMITRNKINGLLSCNERFLDGKTCLYYDISSRQSLAQIYEAAGIGYVQIRGIVDNLVQVQDVMAEYLLEEACLILEPEYIYMDLETEQLFFLYYPLSEDEQKRRNTYLSLAEFFLEHVDHGEEKAVTAAYQFYKMSRTESFTIASFRTFLERGKTEKAEIIKSTGNELLFQEEEGVYEYRVRTNTENEGNCYVEPELRNAEKIQNNEYDEQKQADSKISMNVPILLCILGILFSAGILAALCMILWYIPLPSIWNRVGYFLMAASGFTLLLLIRKLFFWWGDQREKEKSVVLQESVCDGSQNSMIWESRFYDAGAYSGNSINGPTVFVGNTETDETRQDIPRLFYTDGKTEREFVLDPLPMMVGKLKSKVQILLSDASVSRIHARFVEKDGQLALIDMNSTNGTYVNNIRMEQEEIVLLEDGDEIRFGNVKTKLYI